MSDSKTGIAVISPSTFQEAQDMSLTLAKSALLGTLTNKPSDILLILMTGAELGFAPAQSLRAIDIIKGKPTLKAETMAALVRRSPVCEYLTLVSSDATKAVYETKRKGSPSPVRMEFTAADAATAKLQGNENYQKFPKAMLRARCVSALCKAEYSDLLLGVYDQDEIDVTPMGDAVLEYTPSTAPRASPPQVAEFREEPSALTLFTAELAKCTTVAEMEAVWKASGKGTDEEQAKKAVAYRLRKEEIQKAAQPAAQQEQA